MYEDEFSVADLLPVIRNMRRSPPKISYAGLKFVYSEMNDEESL